MLLQLTDLELERCWSVQPDRGTGSNPTLSDLYNSSEDSSTPYGGTSPAINNGDKQVQYAMKRLRNLSKSWHILLAEQLVLQDLLRNFTATKQYYLDLTCNEIMRAYNNNITSNFAKGRATKS